MAHHKRSGKNASSMGSAGGSDDKDNPEVSLLIFN